ncbi:MAG: NUDIX hydrolase [Candidatus Thorarchaeota archaeon]
MPSSLNDNDLSFHRLVATVVILNGNNEVCLIKEKRFISGKDIIRWTLPSGLIKFGEKLIDGAIREVKEETNFSVQPTCLLGIIDWSKEHSERLGSHSGHHGIDFIFGAKYLDGNPVPQHEEGILEILFVPIGNTDKFDLKDVYINAIKRFIKHDGLFLTNEVRDAFGYKYADEYV